MASNLRRSKRSFGQRFLRAEEQIDSASKKPSPKRIGSRIVTSSNLAPGAITTVTLAPEVSTAIVYAQATADGKNTIYYQSSEPSGGIYAQDDIWFDTDDSHKMYRYNTSTPAWEGFQLGDNAIAELSANKITAGTIDASVITVSNLDAGNLTSGTITAVNVGAVDITGATISGGTLDIGSGTFQVDSSGNLTATSATLSGKLSSNNVTVGDLTGIVSGASGLYITATTDNWLYQTSTGVNKFKAGASNNVIALDTGSTSGNYIKLEGSYTPSSGVTQTQSITMGYSSGDVRVASTNVGYNGKSYTYNWQTNLYGERIDVGNQSITGLYATIGNYNNAVAVPPSDAGQYVGVNGVNGNVERFNATTRYEGDFYVGSNAKMYYRGDYQSLYVDAQPRFEMRQSGTWSIPGGGTETDLSWNVGVHARPTASDTLTQWWTGSNPVNFRCPVDGWYMFSAQVLIDSGTSVTGIRQIHFLVTRAGSWTTDNRYGTSSRWITGGADVAISSSAIIRCRAGDTVKVVAYATYSGTRTWGQNRRDINTFSGILLFGATSNYWV